MYRDAGRRGAARADRASRCCAPRRRRLAAEGDPRQADRRARSSAHTGPIEEARASGARRSRRSARRSATSSSGARTLSQQTPARRHAAEGPALLLEVRVPARRSSRTLLGGVDRARVAQLSSPHSAIIFFPIGGALNALPERPLRGGQPRRRASCSTSPRSWERAEDDAANIEWARTAWQRHAPLLDRRHLRQLPHRGGRRRSHPRRVRRQLRPPGARSRRRGIRTTCSARTRTSRRRPDDRG